MALAKVYNTNGEQVGEIELSDEIFNAPVKTEVLHEVVLNYLANQRQGTHATKTRGMVRGGGKKPWRQKGTGRARQGSIRAPQWIKGGVVFGPHPRSYRYNLPKSLKKVAWKSALSSKYSENKIIVLDNLFMDKPKTKEIINMLNNLDVDDKALIVLADRNENVYKSSRNIPGVKTTYIGQLNVYDILTHDTFIITKDAVNKVEEVYS
ncbi:50S ribosomal protein L4 [Calorimonas adulescens]|uniref:Large ribosomal subunit protein uL4 n=1 Tax=Calorimonas adulescens TaxID=2606906 RepID=A0A5D8QDY9_9THEO|nr:50S ribosomal protein L4 [Calorimonas adulescens]TZE82721.1 50S ribosomal protein L4 [Calorimonas adulescens]